MSLDDAIQTSSIIDKLNNLKKYMPNEDETVYHFGAFLANRLPPRRIYPHGFNNAVELALLELESGVDRRTGESLVGSAIVCAGSQFYEIMRMCTPDIAQAVCPEEFAREVIDFYHKVNASLREGQNG